MLRIAVLSSILYLAASSGLSAEQTLKPPANDVIIPQDEYVMIPRSQLKAWYGEVLELVNQYKAAEELDIKLKELVETGLGCT